MVMRQGGDSIQQTVIINKPPFTPIPVYKVHSDSY